MFLPSNITLKLGDSGDYVAELQRRLSTRDYLSSDMITGLYDGSTLSAVRAFQTASGIRADGVAGPETLRRLNGLTDSTYTEDRRNGSEEPDKALLYARQQEQEQLIERERIFALEATQKQNEIGLGFGASTPTAGLESSLSVNKELDSRTRDLLNKLPDVSQEAARGPHLGKRVEVEQPNQELLQTKQLAQETLLTQQRAAEVRTAEPVQQQQAFIDRPITQTLQSPPKAPEAEKTEGVIEQAISGQTRGPTLQQTPERSSEVTAPAKTSAIAEGISAPKEHNTELAKTPASDLSFGSKDKSPSASLNTSLQSGTSMSPVRPEASRSFVTPPDFDRIRSQMEARLSPPVIQEVKQVGTVMVERGVNPAKMPPSVEAPAQTPNMPERSPAVGGGRGA